MVDYFMAYNFNISWMGAYRGMGGYWKENGNFKFVQTDVSQIQRNNFWEIDSEARWSSSMDANAEKFVFSTDVGL